MMHGISSSIYIGVLISIICVDSSECVKIQSVGLTNGHSYAEKEKSAHFTFNATLEPNEVIQSVVWTKDNETGSYEWTKEGAKGSGVFSVAQNTSDSSGDFIFNSVKLSQSGNYTVNVTTNMGTDTGVYQFFVHYSRNFRFQYDVPNIFIPQELKCLLQVTVEVDNVTPYPNVSCIFEGGLDPSAHVPLNNIANITENITALDDGTYNYQMKAVIKMKNIPIKSLVVCSEWVQNSSIHQLTFTTTDISGQPCPEPPNKKDYVYKMVNYVDSCYGGYAPFSEFSYSCIDGPKTEKSLKCKEGKWTEANKEPWPVCNQTS